MPISVNEAIERLEELDGKNVEIFGVLNLEFEGFELIHIPSNERREPYGSCIWTEYDLKKMGITEDVLRQFDGRQVIVAGILKAPIPGFRGCGHFSLWPAEIEVNKVTKRKLTNEC